MAKKEPLRNSLGLVSLLFLGLLLGLGVLAYLFYPIVSITSTAITKTTMTTANCNFLFPYEQVPSCIEGTRQEEEQWALVIREDLN